MQLSNFRTSRKLVMLIGDVVLISIAYILAVTLVLNRSVLLENVFAYTGLFPVLLCMTGLMLNVNGLYTILYKRFADVLLGTLAAHVCTMILVMALSFLFREYDYSLRVLLITLLLQSILLAVWRYALWHVGRKMLPQQSVMLVGSEERCSRVYYRLQQQPQLNMKLKYICTDLSQGKWKAALKKVDAVLICSSRETADKQTLSELLSFACAGRRWHWLARAAGTCPECA